MEQTSRTSHAPKQTRKVAVIGTYPPRKCGIATFGADLISSLRALDPRLSIDVFAMSDDESDQLDGDIVFLIPEPSQPHYAEAAERINQGGYDLVLIQHEYGIFGGEAGSHLLPLISKLETPIVTTLHTVLDDPSPTQKATLCELIARSSRVVVMGSTASRLLTSIYGADPTKIDRIPHGIPAIEKGSRESGLSILGKGAPLLFTFGFLSPDKGIQHVIKAMPAILAESPEARYVVMGQTHPHIVRDHGEAYRQSLQTLSESLGVTKHVAFIDRFAPIEEVVDCLSAMDYYLTPYLNPKQITSGTLAYSLGSGKAVISTPYVYAKELLADRRGVLVPFADPSATAAAILHLEANPEERHEMGDRAARFGSAMQWHKVAERYLATFEQAMTRPRATLFSSRPLGSKPKSTLLSTQHLETMTDDVGMLQHAVYGIPRREEGYCVDDNARALLFTLALEREAPLEAPLALLQSRYLAFVLSAFNPANQRFRNFMSYERAWLENEGSEDSQGRTLWALGTCVELSRLSARRGAAEECFVLAAPRLPQTTSPRTWAYAILGLAAYARAVPHVTWPREMIRQLATRLTSLFSTYSAPGWLWFEPQLAYANARISQALLEAGEVLADAEMVRVGLVSLDWVMQVQTSADGCFSPIGSNGFYPRAGERALFDQQPIEAHASMAACIVAERLEPDPDWPRRIDLAFEWFTGSNVLGLSLVDPETGGCRDGLHADRLNENQGAEATLSYLCAHAEHARWRRGSKVSARVVL